MTTATSPPASSPTPPPPQPPPDSWDASQVARLSPGGLAWVHSKGRWLCPPHLELLNAKLMAVAAGRCPRLVVSMPPRHGKSELVSKYLPAWYLGTFPDRRVILTSYEADFAASWGRRARGVLADSAELFKVQVSAESKAADRWDLAGRLGGMVTAGVRGPITGRGADLLVIDDPVKNAEDARSPARRESAWDWYTSTAYTRLEPGASVVLVMTRWHRDDLAGRALENPVEGGPPWEVLRLPALAGEADPLGRVPGEPLWPERYPVEALRQIRETVTPYWWSALYDQDPAAEGGTEWPAAWFGPNCLAPCWPPPQRQACVLALDPSKGKDSKAGDYSAYVVLQRSPDRVMWCEAHLYKHDSECVTDMLIDLYLQWKPDGVVIETNQFQQLLAEGVQRRCRERGLVGLPVWETDNQVNKEVRILRLSPYLGRREFRFRPDHAGTRLLLRQLRDFPLGDHDDGPDALEMALRLLIDLCNSQVTGGRVLRLRP